MRKRNIITLTFILCLASFHAIAGDDVNEGIAGYRPSPENLASRKAFQESRFGIFIHWGIYSMMADGECIMHEKGIPYSEYSRLAGGFYPSRFDARQWVSAVKAAGARYITRPQHRLHHRV